MNMSKRDWAWFGWIVSQPKLAKESTDDVTQYVVDARQLSNFIEALSPDGEPVKPVRRGNDAEDLNATPATNDEIIQQGLDDIKAGRVSPVPPEVFTDDEGLVKPDRKYADEMMEHLKDFEFEKGYLIANWFDKIWDDATRQQQAAEREKLVSATQTCFELSEEIKSEVAAAVQARDADWQVWVTLNTLVHPPVLNGRMKALEARKGE